MVKKMFLCLTIIIFISTSFFPVFAADTGLSRDNMESAADDGTNLPYDEWPMFRHDARHTGSVKARAPVTPILLWKVDVGLPIVASPAIANRTVFVGAKNILLAVDERSGRTLWKARLAGEIISSPAVDPKAGKQGLVYAASRGSRSSTLTAFDLLTGSPVWQTWLSTRSSPVIVINPPIDTTADVYPSVPRATLFIGADSRLLAINADTGGQLWSFEAYGEINSSPAADERCVYFGTDNNIIYALHRYTGRGVWKFEAKAPVISSPAVGDQFLVTASTDGIVYCLDKSTGEVGWALPTGAKILSSPAYYGGYIYIGSGMQLLKIHEKGKVVWSSRTLGAAYSSPALASGRVYIGSCETESASIFCFDEITGNRIWSKWMDVVASPAAAIWSLIVPTTGGMLYCFNDLE